MAKKKAASRAGSRAGSRAASEAGDDLASTGWSSVDQRSMGSSGEGVEEYMDDPFEASIEGLYEKRTTTREGSLTKLVALLSSQWQYEECALREETLFQLFLRSLRRGKGAEARLGARALGLHAITLGAGPAVERMHAEALPVLEPIALTGQGPERCSAIDALSMLCFVGAEGPPETLACMDILARVFSTSSCPEAVQATAVRAWTLLLTTVPAWHLEAGWVEARLATLGALLHAPSVAVRASAGEAVSLLYSTCGLASLADAGQQGPAAAPATPASPGSRPPRPRPGGTPRPGGGTEGEEPPTTPGVDLGPRVNGKSVSYSADIRAEPSSGEEESRAEGTSYSAKTVERLEDITARIQDLTTNRGDASRRSQKERAELRTTFRSILTSIEGQTALPTQKIKLRHGDVLLVNSLTAVLRLNAFRRFLAEGFQAHMQDNPLLHEVFNFHPRQEAADRLTALEKRLYRSPASAESKARAQDRRRERELMASYKGSMLSME
uniref:Interferon-related developmental regulator N-terminal domain-containing protein n=1 Tax=Auxenochlorella protothecoides TaxID=3075 RepID=A0A1D1ZUG1_AUXPR